MSENANESATESHQSPTSRFSGCSRLTTCDMAYCGQPLTTWSSGGTSATKPPPGVQGVPQYCVFCPNRPGQA
jgi:hypothetical protein